jgi:solute carrier family 45, member 1/2/4
MTGIGNVLGYLSGYVNLPKIMPFFGNTQFKVLCVIASIALGGTLAISCLYVKERDPREEGPPAPEKGGVIGFFKQVYRSIGRLPPQIRSVCIVQFFAWIGWFPFLFYITTYIGEICKSSFLNCFMTLRTLTHQDVTPFLDQKPDLTKEQIDQLWEKATRVGTFALLIFAITSFSSNIILPFFVAPNYLNRKAPRHPILSRLVIHWLTLRRAWFLSHILFAATMWATLFVRNTWQATALVGVVGISWALTLWAPFALISAEISKRETIRRGQLHDTSRPYPTTNGGEDQAGVILGLHNVAIAAPQIIATLGSSFVFRLLQKGRGESGDDSVGWVLRLGGLAALAAAWMTTKVAEEGEMDEGPEGFLPITNDER